MIADESHNFKDIQSQKTCYYGPLAKAASHVVLISGTPQTKRPWQLYAQVCWPEAGLMRVNFSWLVVTCLLTASDTMLQDPSIFPFPLRLFF